jgi:hypothetical protein
MTAAVTHHDDHHAKKLATLDAARMLEKKAARLRRENKIGEAIAGYEDARTLYADSGFAWESDVELRSEVQKAIARCDRIVQNLKHPKERRASATTDRPNCEHCGKPLRRYKIDGRTFKDGTPKEWGDYGDGRFCGLRCGWGWACNHVAVPKKGMKP